MSAREIIAYAITHAPRGVKGGPYEGDYDEAVPTLRAAYRGERQRAKLWLPIVRSVVPTARIIRIVRKARPSEASAMLVTARRRLAAVAEHMTEHAYQEMASALEVDACRAGPSEASAVEVLRAMVAWVDSKGGGFNAIIARARRVLAASGPDPSEVVRAAMRETEAEEAFSVAPHCGRRGEAAALDAAARARVKAVDAYRKAGGK